MLWKVAEDGRDLTSRLSIGHADLPRLVEAGVDVQVFAVFVEPGRGKPDDLAEADRALDLFDAFEHRAGSLLRRVRRRDDLPRPGERSPLRALLGIEGAHMVGPDLDRLHEFHERGVRLVTLTWNPVNDWADGCQPAANDRLHGGLSPLGRERVAEMNRLGMIVDLSHASPATFDDVLEMTRQPPIASHSCVAALRRHPRNLTDEQLRALARSGGVVGINFFPTFLHDGDPGDVGIEHVIAHVEHVIRVAGEDHVGLGSDFDGIPSTPRGLEDVTRLPKITEHLLRAGYEDRVVRKILGENFLRVFQNVLTN
ncbi:MAG: dipeptidase [Planctomycetes bacterium]|nr:dipeptidase [Planctomycetota bacterium]